MLLPAAWCCRLLPTAARLLARPALLLHLCCCTSAAASLLLLLTLLLLLLNPTSCQGGVLVFDEHGPAEVKEFYAPELDQLRAMCTFRAVEKVRPQISGWRAAAMAGKDDRETRREARERSGAADVQWKHLLVKVDQLGQLEEEDEKLVKELPQV